MKITVASNGELVLPIELRELDGIMAGEQFEVTRLGAGTYLLCKLPKGELRGAVDWLLACPEKDWFQCIPSESTADQSRSDENR